jgi:hypothetical protein
MVTLDVLVDLQRRGKGEIALVAGERHGGGSGSRGEMMASLSSI